MIENLRRLKRHTQEVTGEKPKFCYLDRVSYSFLLREVMLDRQHAPIARPYFADNPEAEYFDGLEIIVAIVPGSILMTSERLPEAIYPDLHGQ